MPEPVKKRRVCVVVSARPSYARIKTAIIALSQRPDVELVVVAMGSALLDRYGRVADVMEREGIRVAREVFMLVEGETPLTSAKSTGLAVLELSTVFHDLKPDVVVTIGDRYETLATAVAASYMNIPVAHVQGGEVTGSIDEKVRHAVTKLADLHLVATTDARRRVIAMGEGPERVIKTGCPSIDLAADVLADPKLDFDPLERYGGVGSKIDIEKGYVLVMQHPVPTEYEDARSQINETLGAIEQVGLPTLWFWPNPDSGSEETVKGIRAARERGQATNVHYFKNMVPSDFLKVLLNARCIVGNSSVAIREAAFLGVPAVNIGSRQTGRERGANVIDVPYDAAKIAEAIQRQLKSERPARDDVYGDGHAGKTIAQLLATMPLTTDKRLTY